MDKEQLFISTMDNELFPTLNEIQANTNATPNQFDNHVHNDFNHENETEWKPYEQTNFPVEKLRTVSQSKPQTQNRKSLIMLGNTENDIETLKDDLKDSELKKDKGRLIFSKIKIGRLLKDLEMINANDEQSENKKTSIKMDLEKLHEEIEELLSGKNTSKQRDRHIEEKIKERRPDSKIKKIQRNFENNLNDSKTIKEINRSEKASFPTSKKKIELEDKKIDTRHIDWKKLAEDKTKAYQAKRQCEPILAAEKDKKTRTTLDELITTLKKSWQEIFTGFSKDELKAKFDCLCDFKITVEQNLNELSTTESHVEQKQFKTEAVIQFSKTTKGPSEKDSKQTNNTSSRSSQRNQALVTAKIHDYENKNRVAEKRNSLKGSTEKLSNRTSRSQGSRNDKIESYEQLQKEKSFEDELRIWQEKAERYFGSNTNVLYRKIESELNNLLSRIEGVFKDPNKGHKVRKGIENAKRNLERNASKIEQDNNNQTNGISSTNKKLDQNYSKEVILRRQESDNLISRPKSLLINYNVNVNDNYNKLYRTASSTSLSGRFKSFTEDLFKTSPLEDSGSSIKEQPTVKKEDIVIENREPSPQFLEVHQFFQDDFSLKDVDGIRSYVQNFEDEVKNFDGEKYSLEYFVLDEKLMESVDKLDKIKCHDDKEATNKKVEAIEYIRSLQRSLDQCDGENE